MNSKAVGIFDSGIGGLTVYKALKERLPGEKVIYLGDTARLPYGSKSADTIIRFSEENTRFLLKKNVKIVVVACNSSSSYAVPYLQEKIDIPVIGVIEAGAEAAVCHSHGRTGVIGTTATIQSKAYEKAILSRNSKLKIFSRDCPLFVPLVEEGWIEHEITRMVIREYLLPMKAAGIDSLVLGCTHYPVLRNLLAQELGPHIKLIDSGVTTAAQVGDILQNLGWLHNGRSEGPDEFFVTDFPERFRKVGEIFLQRKIKKVQVADI